QSGGSQNGGSQSGDPEGSGGGQASPPAPSQQPPEQQALVTASVSVGEGANGGVLGLGADGTGPDIDVTVGSNQVIGNHPPSQGTGIMLGGRLFYPPPAIPAPPG
ncbi:MAG TPA: hypothetical protein VGR20_16040, partial [Acidimicrobiia bacterium]|nr:hypothetical protein [Acidimicrobiia bacterium]